MGKSGTDTRGARGAVAVAPKSTVRVGVGRPSDETDRCKATHDIPWSERCILPRWHDELPPNKLTDDGIPMFKHRDKKDNLW